MPPQIEFCDVDRIFADLGPVPWMCQGLKLAPGAPTIVAGASFSGKTAMMQSVALGVATGTPVWGLYATARGPVAHFDAEQGARITFGRYQRMARAMGVEPATLRGHLRVALYPETRLHSSDAPEAYARALDGVKLAIFDSFRAFTGAEDENNSTLRRYLDLLGEISERTGTTCVVLDHTRKPSDTARGGAKATIRGTTAKPDAAQSIFVLTAGEKGEPVRVDHEKERLTGVVLDPFALRIEDVELDGDPRAGLRVVHIDGDQLESAKRDQEMAFNRRVLKSVRAAPGMTSSKLRGLLGARNENVASALRWLTDQGYVENQGSANASAWFPRSGNVPERPKTEAN